MKKIASIIVSAIALSSITLVSAAETKHTAPVHVETNTTASKPTTTTAERDAAIKKAVAEGKLTKAQGDAILNTGMPPKSAPAPATPMALPASLHSEKRASSTAVDPAMMLGKDAKKIADTKKASTTIKKENKKENVIAKKTLKNKTAPHVKADGTIKVSN